MACTHTQQQHSPVPHVPDDRDAPESLSESDAAARPEGLPRGLTSSPPLAVPIAALGTHPSLGDPPSKGGRARGGRATTGLPAPRADAPWGTYAPSATPKAGLCPGASTSSPSRSGSPVFSSVSPPSKSLSTGYIPRRRIMPSSGTTPSPRKSVDAGATVAGTVVGAPGRVGGGTVGVKRPRWLPIVGEGGLPAWLPRPSNQGGGAPADEPLPRRRRSRRRRRRSRLLVVDGDVVKGDCGVRVPGYRSSVAAGDGVRAGPGTQVAPPPCFLPLVPTPSSAGRR